MTVRRGVSIVLAVAMLLLGVATRVPAALAFPYNRTVGAATILSDVPIDPAIDARVGRANALVAAAGLMGIDRPHSIVLTDGGWRWHVLALAARGSFGLRRPFSAALILNRSDVAADRIYNRGPNGRSRSLSGTIAHEMAHRLTAERIGELNAIGQPLWKWEGFADHVAQESTLSPAGAEQVRRSDPSSPPLAYYDGRRRVAAALRRDPSIDALFR